MEECAELIQECSKNLRRGELFDRPDLKEVGDVYAMIELLVEWDVLWDEIENRRDEKRKLSKWSDLFSASESRLYAEETRLQSLCSILKKNM